MRRTVLLVALALTLAGCPGRFDFGPHAYHDASDLLQAVRAAQAAPARLSGDATVHVTTKRGRFGADHFVALRRPGDLHLETLSFFGSPLALLVVDDGHLVLWDVQSGRAYEGPATPATIGMVAPVDLGPKEIVAILLGTPPLPRAGPVRLELDQKARAYRLVIGAGDRRAVALVDPKDLTLREVDWLEGGTRVAKLVYGRYRRAGKGLFPYEVHYERASGVAVAVSYGEITLDGTLDPGLFAPKLPASVTVVPVGEAPPPEVPQVLPKAPPEAASGAKTGTKSP